MKTKILTLVISAIALVGMQFGMITGASADVDTDLRVTGTRDFENKAIEFNICNDGTTSIKQFVLSLSSTNLEFDYVDTSPFNTAPAAGLGTFDDETLTWTGTLAGSECVPFVASGEFTAGVGATVTTSVSIVSAIQVDDTVNTDNSGNETLVFDPVVIALSPDLLIESSLTTVGTITDTTEVTYQVNLSNQGVGQFVTNPDFFIMVFIMPPDATFVDVDDLDLGDAIGAAGCISPGTVEEVGVGSGLSAYNDRVVVLCQLSVSGDGTLPADDTIYPFAVNMIAGPSLAAGNADVIALVEGNDIDTLELMKTLVSGSDPLLIGSNNVSFLAYDATPLQATVALCPGQSEITTDGTGCFRITFNKAVFAPSFTTEDILLSGTGQVDSLTQLDTLTWEVRISNIAPDTQVTLELVLNQIQDYSAKQNGTQVLGINTIRYDVAGASGTLPETGANSTLSVFATLMILIGFGLLGAVRRKSII